MKKTILLMGLLLLAGCDGDSCQLDFNWRTNQSLRAQLFDKCLARAAEARKGQNYTTNDDEDYDDVIKACDNAAYYMSRYCIYREKK